MTWEDYYDPTKIAQEMKDLGQSFRKRFTLNYEQVAKIHIADVLKDDMVGVAGFAWTTPINGIYPAAPDEPFTHAFLLYQLPKWQVFDNYMEAPNDYTKSLAPDYVFYDYGYRMYLSAESTPAMEEVEQSVFQSLMKYGLLKYFANWFTLFIKTVKGIA